jgi:hypothetical protein
VLPAQSGNNKKLAPVFERDWHDWIVKKDGQLAAFTRYIRENAERAWLRRVNWRYFGQVRKVSFLGREWFAYGNMAILELPVLKAVKGHRTTKPGSAEWEAMVADCGRIGPGGAGVGTFMSPLEKECGNAIAASGGKWVVLSPEGFYDRWHPPREKERFCAGGACSSFRSIHQWIACPRSRSFTVGATRWAISPSQGWSDAGQQGITHKILAPPQGAAHQTRVLCCPPRRATTNKECSMVRQAKLGRTSKLKGICSAKKTTCR